MLAVLETLATLRLTSPGKLLPWLGPALRGLIARRFKANVCRHSPVEQETTWRYCKGCPHMGQCPYGAIFEPDPPANASLFKGQDAATRPFVLAPQFPVPPHAEIGLRIPIRAVFVGEAVARHVPLFFQAVSEAGRDRSAGIEPEHTSFELLPALQPAPQRYLVDLPMKPDALTGVLPRVKVQLTSPLFLRSEDGHGRHHLIAEPSFDDLFRAALRTIGSLFALYDQRLPADFTGLKAAAREVPMIDSSFNVFRQPKRSSRTGKHAQVRATIGSAVYGNVPLALVKWMTWGGRLHVGPNRVAGAGGWRVAWSDAARLTQSASDTWRWSD